jgi:hypothetical protein
LEERNVPGFLTGIEAKRRVKYEGRKALAQKAAAVKAEAEEALRRKMESPQAKPPERLTRTEMRLIAEKYRRKRKLLSWAR